MLWCVTTKQRVEIAPTTPDEWAVMLFTWAVCALVFGGIAMVQSMQTGPWGHVWSGWLFVLAGVFAVGGVVIRVGGGRS